MLLLLAGCSSEDVRQGRRIDGFLEEHGSTGEGVHTVLVLTDAGCPSCNRSFMRFITDHVDRPATRVVVSAVGRHFDISGLLDRKGSIIWDNTDGFVELGILEGSGAVLLDGGRVDTVIPLQAADIERSLAYLKERLR